MNKSFFICTFFLIRKYQRIKTANELNLTFLDTRKVTKEYALAKEFLKLFSVTLKRINSLRSNTIRFSTLHSKQFFHVILLMSEGKKEFIEAN